MADKKKATTTRRPKAATKVATKVATKLAVEGNAKKPPKYQELSKEEVVECLARLKQWLEVLTSAVDHSDGTTFRVPTARPVQRIMGQGVSRNTLSCGGK
jgi:hypothetical protein